jgi:S-formylglutathione hydrolase FrmB
MGGGGSFMYALHRPDLFSSACPLSASTGPLNLEEAKTRLRQRNQPVPVDVVLEEYYKNHSAVNLIESMSADDIKKVRWYIDCGDDDFLFEGNSLVHIALRKKEVPHEYRVRDGSHSWTYWREALPEVLSFVSEAFHQH